MNQVSLCCGSSVVAGVHHEYPLGGNRWRETYKIDVCEGCGKECDTVVACGMCGEVMHDEVNCQAVE